MTETTVIETRGLRKVFADGTAALDGVDLTVKKGEFVCILGPSGAGKSTLMRCLLGLIPASAGSARVADVDVTRARPPVLRRLRRQVGCIFQQFNLVGRLTVLENVLVGRLGYTGWAGTCRRFTRRDRELALLALERVGLLEKAWQRADTLSGGQQQRVAVARALCQQPQLVLADEPVSNLDPRLAEVILGYLRDINEREGVTTVVNLHTVELARAFGRRVVGMSAGRVVYDDYVRGLDERALRTIYGDAPRREHEGEVPAHGQRKFERAALGLR